ncbi:hypothetical protein [Povalibacter sp.]|uniref:hypothetical protein n=1 Tax=Povalibacter sp. TaxID=1962978 RepID=UPI002F4030E5
MSSPQRLRRRAPDNVWSSESVRKLRELAEAGAATEVIAAHLGRTPSAVRNKAGLHGISLRKRDAGGDAVTMNYASEEMSWESASEN